MFEKAIQSNDWRAFLFVKRVVVNWVFYEFIKTSRQILVKRLKWKKSLYVKTFKKGGER